MTNVGFKKLLKEAFERHCLMKGRDYHTVNELLHMLRYDDKLKNLNRVNISVCKTDGGCMSIPCLDAFVNLNALGIWFDDNTIEFESDEFDNEGELIKFDNITVYEREEI